MPTLTFTSMFEEPSSGSNNNRYSPFGKRCGMACGSSISSDAIAARCPPHSLASSRISLAMTSRLLLRLALHVDRRIANSRIAEKARQCAFANVDGNGLDGARKRLDQQPQIGWHGVMFVLFVDEKAGEGDAVHVGCSAEVLKTRLQPRRRIAQLLRRHG